MALETHLGVILFSIQTDWLVLFSCYCSLLNTAYLLIIQIRLVVEEGLNCLPSFKQVITTPTGKSAQ